MKIYVSTLIGWLTLLDLAAGLTFEYKSRFKFWVNSLPGIQNKRIDLEAANLEFFRSLNGHLMKFQGGTL